MLHGTEGGRTISVPLAFSHRIPELWHLYLWSALDYQVVLLAGGSTSSPCPLVAVAQCPQET